MKIDIGKVIKDYRIKNKITQENLAEKLSVSPQAISRWESGAGYPDIEIIPKIAEIYNISIEILFGINKKEEELKIYKDELKNKIHKMEWKQRLSEVRIAHDIYPDDEEIIFILGSLLCTAVANNRNELSETENIQYYHEADILLNRILEISTDEKMRRDSTALLVQELYSIYDLDKAIKMAQKLSPAGLTMQNQTMHLLKGEERIEFAKKYLPLMFQQLISFGFFAKYPDYDNKNKTNNFEESIEELYKLKTLYDCFYGYLGTVLEERKYSDSFYRNLFMRLFKSLENEEDSISALEQYVKCCGSIENEIENYNIDASSLIYLSIAVSKDDDLRLKITRGEFSMFGEILYYLLLRSPKSEYYSENPKFNELAESLKKLGPKL